MRPEGGLPLWEASGTGTPLSVGCGCGTGHCGRNPCAGPAHYLELCSCGGGLEGPSEL